MIHFSPPRLSEAPVLEEDEGHHRHEGMTMQTAPGSPFEVVEAELFLQLLVGFFADPECLDGGGQGAQLRPGGQVGEIIIRLAR